MVSTENAREFSSAIKGETVEDTIRIINGYADAIVIRHYEQGAATAGGLGFGVPIINAGDGPGEHPTQALLDLYTIRHELGRIDDLTVALVGDLRFGRAVRSLAMLLPGPPVVGFFSFRLLLCQWAKMFARALTRAGIPFEDTADLRSAVAEADVVYQTRIQRERFAHRIGVPGIERDLPHRRARSWLR